jgi:uncharacterized membrane protein YagU involved in acid resistance
VQLLPLLRQTLNSGAAGLVATAPMTAVMLGARQIGLLHTPPPEQISARAAAKVPSPVLASRTAQPLWPVAHGGYGVVCGVAYGALRPWLPSSTAQAGFLFGGMVWSVSYLGLMPALDLYPWPAKDASPRRTVTIVAHAVYGVTLAAVVQRLDQQWLVH